MSGNASSREFSHTVLIAAHDGGLRAALEFLLGVEGHRVLAVDSGEALLRLQLPECRACLLVDQDLPGLSGLQTIAALRRRGVQLPAVLLAAGLEDLRWLLKRQAPAQLIKKPLLGGDVLDAVARAFTPAVPPSSGTP